MAEPVIEEQPAVIRPVAPAATYAGLERSELDRIAENMELEYQIGHQRHHPMSQRRFVKLRINELYDTLVTRYANLFTTDWSYIRTAFASRDLTGIVNREIHAARIYISAWIWDLYVSIRKCVKEVSGTGFNQRYRHEMYHISDRYDPFLQHLNAVIRPTHIQGAQEDAVYIPYFHETPNWIHQSSNFFEIPFFELDESIATAIIQLMDSSSRNNKWSTIPLVSNVFGRPGWLFDYRLGHAYAWFPMEQNYSTIDLIAPHILGIPLTPRLGTCDVDEWQFLPAGMQAAENAPHNYNRVNPRAFYGSAEYVTIERDQWDVPYFLLNGRQDPAHTGQKRPRQEATGSGIQPPAYEAAHGEDDPMNMQLAAPPPPRINRYRIRNWTYFAQVTLGTNSQTRNRALKSFIFRAAAT